jgi:hypothetical protein
MSLIRLRVHTNCFVLPKVIVFDHALHTLSKLCGHECRDQTNLSVLMWLTSVVLQELKQCRLGRISRQELQICLPRFRTITKVLSRSIPWRARGWQHGAILRKCVMLVQMHSSDEIMVDVSMSSQSWTQPYSFEGHGKAVKNRTRCG